MTKNKAAQQDSALPKEAKNDTAAESPAEQKKTSSAEAAPETKAGAAEGDSSESPAARKTGAALYPEGAKLFKYQPKGKPGEDQTIYFPMEFDRPDKVWLWELNQLPFLNQTWAWMDRAKVPKAIQRQVVSIPDDEYSDVFSEWFEAMGGGATPGE